MAAASLPTPSVPGTPAPSTPAAPPRPPRVGAYREVGSVRHASIHAQRYRLQGTGKVLGAIDVEEGQLDGILSIGGDLTAGEFESKGSLEVGGNVSIDAALLSRGSTRVSGSLTAASARLEGLTRVTKDVRVTTSLAVEGGFEVGGSVRAALFAPDGRWTIEGTLAAREITGRFDSESRVATIEAGNVTLRPRALVRLPIDVPPLRPKGMLTVDRIEAESVDLEGVTVHYLKAPTIVLGRHCHVAQLEGTVVKRDRSSVVGFESRSPPPYGLSR